MNGRRPVSAPRPRLTESDLLAMLRSRYGERAGNGNAWALITHVRNAAGFDADRTVDAIAMSLWPSRGLTLHGFEIKCSRADWQRELAVPEKAEAFARLVDRWWLVVADATIVQPGELPEGWGLLAASGRKLRCVTEARPLRPEGGVPGAQPLPDAFSRSFLAALLRSACRSGQDELAEARAAARVDALRQTEDRILGLEKTISALKRREQVFERESGVRMDGWHGEHDVRQVAAAVRLVLSGEQTADVLRQRLERIAEQARLIAYQAAKVLEESEAADA